MLVLVTSVSNPLCSEFDPIPYNIAIINIPAPPAPIANNFDLTPTVTAAPVSVCMGGSEIVALECVVECVVVIVVEWNEVTRVEEEMWELSATVFGTENAGMVVKMLVVKVLVLQLQEEVLGRTVVAEILVLGAAVMVMITTEVAVAVGNVRRFVLDWGFDE